jgi:hypothetical protein
LFIALESYLKKNIDDYVLIKPWKEKDILPVFIRNLYRFYWMTILDTSCLLIEIIDEAPGVDVIKKHIKRIAGLTNLNVVLYYKDITRYRRKSLIKNCISFIVENGQVFLPFVVLDIKNTSHYTANTSITFSPATQKAYLYFLYNKDLKVNTTEFAKKMEVAVMTSSRVLNDMYDAKLLSYEIGGKTGRSKEYQRISDPEYLIIGRDLIRSPIKKVVYVRDVPTSTLVAGMEALSELSMINPPGYPVRAIGYEQFQEIENEIEIIKNKDIIKDERLVELQIWEYNPQLYSKKKHVDLMSLYVSLKEERDERVEQALEDVLRGEEWYMD